MERPIQARRNKLVSQPASLSSLVQSMRHEGEGQTDRSRLVQRGFEMVNKQTEQTATKSTYPFWILIQDMVLKRIARLHFSNGLAPAGRSELWEGEGDAITRGNHAWWPLWQHSPI